MLHQRVVAEVVSEATRRKNQPLATGVLDYFPDALLAVAELSRVGNEQHNPGTPLRWDRSKSNDEADALARHFLERGKIDSDGVRHSAKVAWRALALLQKEIEAARVVDTQKPNEFIDRYQYPTSYGHGGLGQTTSLVPMLEADIEEVRDDHEHAHYVPADKMGAR